MSRHMVARWYRPPEIILSVENYDQRVDIWSLGCVFAEMMYVWDKPENEKDVEDRFIFPGSACNPLSPMAKDKGE
jgi:serine/threonine protein kinase